MGPEHRAVSGVFPPSPRDLVMLVMNIVATGETVNVIMLSKVERIGPQTLFLQHAISPSLVNMYLSISCVVTHRHTQS